MKYKTHRNLTVPICAKWSDTYRSDRLPPVASLLTEVGQYRMYQMEQDSEPHSDSEEEIFNIPIQHATFLSNHVVDPSDGANLVFLSVFADQGCRPIVNVSTLYFRVLLVLGLPRTIMWLTRVLASWYIRCFLLSPRAPQLTPAAALS